MFLTSQNDTLIGFFFNRFLFFVQQLGSQWNDFRQVTKRQAVYWFLDSAISSFFFKLHKVDNIGKSGILVFRFKFYFFVLF